MRFAERRFNTAACTRGVQRVLITAFTLSCCSCHSPEASTGAAAPAGSYRTTPAAALPKKPASAETIPAKILGAWSAESKTAASITGAIVIDPAAVRLKGTTLAVSSVRRLSNAETKSLGSELLSGGTGGVLLQIGANANPALLNGNTLCTRPAAWMAAMQGKNELYLAVFQGPEGAQEPPLGGPALANSKDLCGTYTYSRP